MASKDTAIVIRADDKTAAAFKAVLKNVNKLNKDTKRLNSSFGGLGRTLLGVGGIALGIKLSRSIVETTDKYKRLNSLIRVVTSSTEQQVQVNHDLFQVAKATRSEFDATVKLYARVARNAEVLGLSQQDLLDIVTVTNQALQIGGNTTREAAAGIIQLSQALASGTLRGDEFRSVMENMPRLAIAIADGIDAPIGKLRELSQSGQLTASVVVDSLKSQSVALQHEFDTLDVTASSVLQTIQNQFERSISNADSQGMVQSLIDFRTLLEDPATGQSVQDFATLVVDSLTFVTESTTAVIQGIQNVGKAMAEADMGSGGLDESELLGKELFLTEKLNKAWEDKIQLGIDDGVTIKLLEEQLGEVLQLQSAMEGLTGATVEQIDAQKEKLKSDFLIVAAAAKAAQKVEELRKKLTEQALEARLGADEFLRYQLTLLDATEKEKEQIIALQAATREWIERQKALAIVAREEGKRVASIEKILLDLEEEKQKVSQNADGLLRWQLVQKGATEEQILAAIAIQKTTTALQISKEAKEDLKAETDRNNESDAEFLEGLEKQLEALHLGADAVSRLKAEKQLSADASAEEKEKAGELQIAIEGLTQAASDEERQFKALKSAVEGWGRSFADELLEGELNFKNFAGSIVKQLARIAIAQAVTGLFDAFSGGLSGGGTSLGGKLAGSLGKGIPAGVPAGLPSVPLPKTTMVASGGVLPGGFQAFANGGIANKPTLGLIGEGGMSEAVVPLPDGKSIPIKGGGGQTINITINAPGADAGTMARMEEIVKVKLIPQIIESSKAATINSLRRPRFS